jgi:hypothetical protein
MIKLVLNFTLTVKAKLIANPTFPSVISFLSKIVSKEAHNTIMAPAVSNLKPSHLKRRI